mgnify:CR=1 FL=1
MKTSAIIAKNDIFSPLIHIKYWVADSKLKVFVFWKSLENADGFSYGITDEQAAAILASDQLSALEFKIYFNSKQLGVGSEETTYWQLSDRRELDLTDSMMSSAEVEPPIMWTMLLTHDGRIQGPYNKFVETFNRKSTTGRDANIEGGIIVATAFSRFKKPTSFSQCRLALSYSQHTFFDCNLPADQDISTMSYADRYADLMSYQPTITLSGNNLIEAGNTQTLNIVITDPVTNSSLTDYTANVYIEHTGGYVNKQRVLVTPAGANVVVRALDLDPGDQFKVKVGWRNYSGVSEINYTVV